MKISLNGLELKRIAEGSLTVKDILQELQTEIHSSNKLLLKAILDGDPLASEWERDYRIHTPVSSARHLELIIDEPRHLTRQLLKDSGILIERLSAKTGGLAHKFRVGSDVVANNELAEFLDELKLVVSGLDMTTRQSSTRPDLSAVRIQIEATASKLVPTLERVYQAQAAGDTIALADEIQYELPGLMNRWRDLIAETTRVLETQN
jgi:hypothetical protein